jgi:hypothetical protein
MLASRLALRASASILVGLLLSTRSVHAAVEVFEFDGDVPAGVVLHRLSAAIDGDGNVVGSGLPRFQSTAVTAGARLLGQLPVNDVVIGTASVGGIQYTIVQRGAIPELTTDTPGVTPSPHYVLPAAANLFSYGGSAWGFPSCAQILSDGSLLIHTAAAGAERRSLTLRTTLSTYSDPNGFAVVRVGDYQPPAGAPATMVLPNFTRATFLPNLGLEVLSIAEYQSDGLISQVYPGTGRDLGYVSVDSGRTWRRAIDSDLNVPDHTLEPSPRHLHHLQPFEWWDAQAGAWKVGVVAILGDDPNGLGQMIARANGPVFPDLATDSYASIAGLKVGGVHELTDLFPLSSSGAPAGGPAFLHGADATQAGEAQIELNGDLETDLTVFRPTVSLTRAPFVFQLDQLGSGAIIAPNWDRQPVTPTGSVWVSDPSGTFWSVAYLANHAGFRGTMPVGTRRFWTLAGASNSVSSLFDLGIPKVRRALLLGPSAQEVLAVPAFASNASISTTIVTGSVPRPPGTDPSIQLVRVRSETLAKNDTFSSGVAQPVAVAKGQFVELAFWVKPVQPRLGAPSFEAQLDLQLAGGGGVAGSPARVLLDLNDWTQVVVTEKVTIDGVVSVLPRLWPEGSASTTRPFDYYFSAPSLLVSSQPTVGEYRKASATAADNLSVPLPGSSGAWSVAVWATESPTFVMSLLSSGGESAAVAPTAIPSEKFAFGEPSALSLTLAGTASGAGLVGQTGDRDVLFPTQDLVVVTRSQPDNRLTLYVARGMGEVETIEGPPSSGFDASELRFTSPSGDRSFEGTIHRIKVWDDTALAPADVEQERVNFGNACGLGGELPLALLGLRRLLRRRRDSARA